MNETGFWAIDEKPTGSKDPFALRRAALGVIRLVLTNEVRFDLASTLLLALSRNILAVGQGHGAPARFRQRPRGPRSNRRTAALTRSKISSALPRPSIDASLPCRP